MLTLSTPLQRLENLTQICLHQVINSSSIKCKALSWPARRKGRKATCPMAGPVLYGQGCAYCTSCLRDSQTITSPCQSAPGCLIASTEWWSNKEATIFPGSNSQWLPLYVCIWFVVWLFPKLYEQRAAFIFILSNKTYPLSIHWVSWKRSSKRVSISFPSLLENRDKNILASVLLLWMHIS